MSDTSGADNTEIGNVTIFDTAYFDQDYKLQAVWLGLLWWLISYTPAIAFNAARPGWHCDGLGYCGWTYLSAGAWHAWYVLQYGLGGDYALMGLFWLLAYIKRDDRIFQRIYYRAMAWGTGLSWLFFLWSLIAFIVGGTQYRGEWAGLGYWFGFAVFVGGCQFLGFYWLAPRVVKFYKFDQQDWWNYNKDEVPDVWPKQLGEFVDY